MLYAPQLFAEYGCVAFIWLIIILLLCFVFKLVWDFLWYEIPDLPRKWRYAKKEFKWGRKQWK